MYAPQTESWWLISTPKLLLIFHRRPFLYPRPPSTGWGIGYGTNAAQQAPEYGLCSEGCPQACNERRLIERRAAMADDRREIRVSHLVNRLR